MAVPWLDQLQTERCQVIKLADPLVYRVLKRFFPGEISKQNAHRSHLEPYESRIVKAAGLETWNSWKSGTILDFGCGAGEGAIQLAVAGARRVIGIDIRPDLIASARSRAIETDVADRCKFSLETPEEVVDTIISIDAFEHFKDPAAVLVAMSNMLADDGRVVASFGPVWYHPRGGHLFSVFPWAHLLLSESALCRWRRDFRDDGATKFSEVTGGLNGMTIHRFEELLNDSPLQIDKLSHRPIYVLRYLHNRWTREFFTSVTDCILVKR